MSSAPVKVRRKENETAEERLRRHAEKKSKVRAHRTEILQRVNQQKGRQELHKREDFISAVRFDNTLPPVPLDPKLLEYPFDEDLVTGYDVLNGISSEAGLLHQLHTEPDMGIQVNLIDPSVYMSPAPGERPPMHEVDALISSADFAKPATRKVEAMKEEAVDWMMRTTYMHLDLYDSVYKHADPTAVQEAALKARRQQLEKAFAGSRKDRIEASFRAVGGDSGVLVHPTARGLQPKRVWEVLPDPDRWSANQVVVSFESDPAPAGAADAAASGSGSSGAGPAAKRARLEHAVLRTPAAAAPAVNVAEGTVVVDYLLPRAADVEAATRADDDASRLAASASPSTAPAALAASKPLALGGQRQYHMVVERVQRQKGDEHYVLHWDDAAGAVYLAPIRARALVSKFAAIDGDASSTAGSAAAGGSGIQPVLLHRRPYSHDEADARAIVRADMTREDAPDVRASIADQRRARALGSASSSDSSSSSSASSAADDSAGAGDSGDGSGSSSSSSVSGVKRKRDEVSGGSASAAAGDAAVFEEE